MRRPVASAKPRRLAVCTLCLAFSASVIYAQQQAPQRPTDGQDDVIRITSELVQTDVTVFDKQGRFVEDLKPEQFELKVDGQLVPVSFFELVKAGGPEEEAQLAAARRGEAVRAKSEGTAAPDATARGRSLLFFVDDLHLDADSLGRTRRMLTDAVEKEMAANDRALVTAASGQLGAQQLTNDKDALKATVGRIALRPGVRRDLGQPPMSEAQAVQVNRGDRSLIDYYVEQILKFEPSTSREVAEERVKGRADKIVEQSSAVATATLGSLESFLRDVSHIPGRKLVFFVSDGFVVENERSLAFPRMRRATDEATRAGVVIYALNARGLVTGTPDASESAPADGRVSRAVYGAQTLAQDVLYTLAADTGGRALVNTNDLNAGVRRALEETSKYYLIAWRPPKEGAAGGGLKRIEISVAGRPDLKVRTRRDPGASVSSALAAVAPTPDTVSPAEELSSALRSPSPRRGLPASLVVIYRDAGGAGFAATASMQIPSASLSFKDEGGARAATVDVAGVVLDEQGKEVTSFERRVSVNADSNALDPTHKLLFYNHELSLAPGRYQIRMGARDAQTGQLGSATSSFEIPDVSKGRLALSSLMLVEQMYADQEEAAGGKPGVQKGVTQRFARAAHLRFLTYVYNAARAAANDNAPDLDVKVQVLQGNRAVANPDVREIAVDEEGAKRYPFAAEIPLEGLPPGEYALQVTVTDKATGMSATQQAKFVIE